MTRLWRALAFAGSLAAVAFVVVAFRDSLDRTEGETFPGVGPLVVAGALVAAAHVAAAWSWRHLLPADVPRAAASRTWYVSQLAKYVPGGLLQAAGQIAMTARLGVPARLVTTRFLGMAGGFVVAGLAVGVATAPLASDSSTPVRALAMAGGLTVVFLWRPLQAWGLGLVARMGERALRPDDLPDQPTILRSWAGQVVFMVVQGVSFALVLDALVDDAPLGLAVVAFPLAFALGTLAVPVPSGLAVREAALAALIGPAVVGDGSAVVITAAIWHRLAVIAAEVALAGAHEVRVRLARPAAVAPDA